MWSKLDKIGPPIIKKSIPMEVDIDGVIIYDQSIVMSKWMSYFWSLYKGIPREHQDIRMNSYTWHK